MRRDDWFVLAAGLKELHSDIQALRSATGGQMDKGAIKGLTVRLLAGSERMMMDLEKLHPDQTGANEVRIMDMELTPK